MPESGDVVVFKLPSDGRTDYIKRVIGRPGDKIQMIQGVLHINGNPVSKERVDDFIPTNNNGIAGRVPQYRETLPNGVTYTTLDMNPNGRGDNTTVFSVPDGHLFMMGDNRDNSSDSRFAVGFVPYENLVGKAQILFFSTDGSAAIWQFWGWPSAIRWSRFFNSVE
jgi:signal peptidase I